MSIGCKTLYKKDYRTYFVKRPSQTRRSLKRYEESGISQDIQCRWYHGKQPFRPSFLGRKGFFIFIQQFVA